MRNFVLVLVFLAPCEQDLSNSGAIFLLIGLLFAWGVPWVFRLG